MNCKSTGNFFNLTNINALRFVGIKFVTSTASIKLFRESTTFNCSWAKCLSIGTHSSGSPQPNQVCFDLTNNSDDNYIENSREMSAFGVGIMTASFANYLIHSKIANRQYGIQSAVSFSAGMVISDSSLASTPGGTTISQIYIPDNSGKWLISNTDMEGATATVAVGGSSLTGSTAAGTGGNGGSDEPAA